MFELGPNLGRDATCSDRSGEDAVSLALRYKAYKLHFTTHARETGTVLAYDRVSGSDHSRWTPAQCQTPQMLQYPSLMAKRYL